MAEVSNLLQTFDLEADDCVSHPVEVSQSGRGVLARTLLSGLGKALAATAVLGFVGGSLELMGIGGRGAHHREAVFESHLKDFTELTSVMTKCRDSKEGDSCYFSVHWAMTEGIFGHPDWYQGLTPASSFGEFQYSLYKSGATNCTSFKPCDIEAIKQKAAAGATAAANVVAEPPPPPGPRAQTFYMYRAQSQASYPLENINTADLAGALWYLHNEVVVATPRKYKIDRVKRFMVTVKNTWEFWNAHKRQFSAFVAYDAGGCTTPVCKDIYHQYGFVVGCQVQPLSVAKYMGREQTNWQCRAGEDNCKAPIWYSLPGACPAKGIPNGAINPNSVDLDVDQYKSPECTKRMPGGLCKAGVTEPTGAPDCTYTYEDAGEIFLDELVGLQDYNQFWNTSYTQCMKDKAAHVLPTDHLCLHNKEYDPITDTGVGTSFWAGKLDADKCTDRLDKARKLFKKNFPQFPEHLEEPACEFDMYYGGEFAWSINHTGSAKSDWWEQRM
mmetsp:Transcript_116525/g.370631  ORF Transcript_116525/g.370631 Transcript_116525/m.370631 type:complete len:499 (-) Transcript_116525:329-1825(-)